MPDKPKETNGQQPDSSFIQLDDPKQKGAASAASAPRRKALLGVLTAACTILIVVSLGFVHPSTSGAWSIDWIIQTVTGESVVTKDTKASGSTTTSGEASSKDSKSSNDAKDESKDSDESKSKDDSESSSKESDKNRIARSPMVRTARSLAINPLPKIREPVILPMCLVVLLRAVASRLMEPHPLMVETPPRAARAAHRSPTT